VCKLDRLLNLRCARSTYAISQSFSLTLLTLRELPGWFAVGAEIDRRMVNVKLYPYYAMEHDFDMGSTHALIQIPQSFSRSYNSPTFLIPAIDTRSFLRQKSTSASASRVGSSCTLVSSPMD
jgi:hypothetical protein